jgi:hypothetical protein
MDQTELLDENLYKVISKCFINSKRPDSSEIYVIYTDDSRETIWTFNPVRYDFNPRAFIGKTKIEAVFYCDRKKPRSVQLY